MIWLRAAAHAGKSCRNKAQARSRAIRQASTKRWQTRNRCRIGLRAFPSAASYRRKCTGEPRGTIAPVLVERNYQRPGGSDDEREVAAKWLRTRVPDASAECLVIYPGNQAILFNALMSLTSPGDVVLTETLTFPGVKAAAEKLRLRLVGRNASRRRCAFRICWRPIRRRNRRCGAIFRRPCSCQLRSW